MQNRVSENESFFQLWLSYLVSDIPHIKKLPEKYYKTILLQIMDETWESYSPVSTKTLDKIRAGDDKYLKVYLSDIRLHAIFRDKKYSTYDFQI